MMTMTFSPLFLLNLSPTSPASPARRSNLFVVFLGEEQSLAGAGAAAALLRHAAGGTQ